MPTIRTLQFNPRTGQDEIVNTPIDYVPSNYTDHESAAKGLYEALCKVAVSIDGSSEEVALFEPSRTKSYSGYEQWCVVWESGPYDWAIALSMELQGPWGHTEPYYGFDLHFTT